MQYRADFLVRRAHRAASGRSPRWCRCSSSSASARPIAGWTLRRGAAGGRLVHAAAGRARGRRQPQPHRRWSSTSARARWTSCCSSPPTRSSWSRPRASSRGGSSTSLTALVHLRLRVPRCWGAGRRCRGVLAALVLLVHAHAAALLAVDPDGERGLLGGEGRQPHLPLHVHLRRRALARRRLPGRWPSSSRSSSRWR